MRALLLIPMLAGLVGCEAVEEADYFMLEPGNTWTYALIQGGADGDEWTLTIGDASDREETQRGDLWFALMRPEPDPIDPDLTIQVPHREFNVSQEADNTGDEPIPIGYTYRAVENEEGQLDQFFVKYAGSDEDWSNSWDFDLESETGTTSWSYEIHAYRSTDPVGTGLGTWEDNIIVDRTIALTSIDAFGDPTTQTRLHHEVWAAGAGLVRYRFTSAEDLVTEAVMRQSTAFTIE